MFHVYGGLPISVSGSAEDRICRDDVPLGWLDDGPEIASVESGPYEAEVTGVIPGGHGCAAQAVDLALNPAGVLADPAHLIGDGVIHGRRRETERLLEPRFTPQGWQRLVSRCRDIAATWLRQMAGAVQRLPDPYLSYRPSWNGLRDENACRLCRSKRLDCGSRVASPQFQVSGDSDSPGGLGQASHCRRAPCAFVSMPTMRVALASMASHIAASVSWRSAASVPAAARASWRARVAFSQAVRAWRRARRVPGRRAVVPSLSRAHT
jgi:hypothetical protein